MSSINIDKDTKHGKLRYLLRLLSLGKLERDSAGELNALLMEELKQARQNNDLEHERELGALVKILDSYQLGQIDLMMQSDVDVMYQT